MKFDDLSSPGFGFACMFLPHYPVNQQVFSTQHGKTEPPVLFLERNPKAANIQFAHYCQNLMTILA